MWLPVPDTAPPPPVIPAKAGIQKAQSVDNTASSHLIGIRSPFDKLRVNGIIKIRSG